MDSKLEHLLIKQHVNWADEIDCSAMFLINKDQWDTYLLKVKELFELTDSQEVYIGTNESIDYDSFASYKKTFKVSKLGVEEFNILRKHIPFNKSYSYIDAFGNDGLINEIDYLLDEAKDIDEDDSDEDSANTKSVIAMGR